MHNSKQKPDNFIFGFRTIIEAVKAGKTIDKLLVKRGVKSELYYELMELVKEHQIPAQYVPVERLDRVTRKNHQGALAFVSEIEFQDIQNILPTIYEKGQDPFILVLDKVTDVRNFGAITRTAECAGVHAIIVPAKNSAQMNADAVKTSAGALHHIPVCRENSVVRTVSMLKDSGLKILAATEKTDQLYFQQQLTGPVALIMGSEEKGISKELLDLADAKLKIPILGNIESLNVSNAASVLIYEIVKQRQLINL